MKKNANISMIQHISDTVLYIIDLLQLVKWENIFSRSSEYVIHMNASDRRCEPFSLRKITSPELTNPQLLRPTSRSNMNTILIQRLN